MGMALGGSDGGRRRGRRGGAHGRVMSDINVTPMVDVMLVLLIVFMVAAPLLTVGVPVDLPQTQAKELNTEGKPVTVTVTPDGALFIGEDRVTLETLLSQVETRAANGTEDRLYIRGDARADYGLVMEVMGALSGAGYARIGLITKQERAP